MKLVLVLEGLDMDGISFLPDFLLDKNDGCLLGIEPIDDLSLTTIF